MEKGLTTKHQMLQDGATGGAVQPSYSQGIEMRSPFKTGSLIELQQNEAGLIVDIALVVLFLVLLAVR